MPTPTAGVAWAIVALYMLSVIEVIQTFIAMIVGLILGLDEH